MGNDEDKKPLTESSRIVEILAQEAEQVVAESCKAAKLEAEQELEKALREYEQRTRQIVLKIREEAKSRTAEIASRLGDAIMMRIEKSSTEAVADAIAGFSKKAEQITQTLQEAAVKEAEQALPGVRAGVESDIKSGNNNNSARKLIARDEASQAAYRQQETKEVAGKVKPGFEIEVERELTGITEDEANGKAQPDSKEFEHWLTQ